MKIMAGYSYILLVLVAMFANAHAAIYSMGTQRTIIMIYKPTVWGEDLFLRGSNGNNDITINHVGLGTSSPAYDKYNAWRVGNTKLTWYGANTGQGSYNGIQAMGSPMVWTSNAKSSASYQPVNVYGDHYWMIDLNVECSYFYEGLFEIKAVIRRVDGSMTWESDIATVGNGCNQYYGTHSTINHWARCGFVNVYNWGSNYCYQQIPSPTY